MMRKSLFFTMAVLGMIPQMIAATFTVSVDDGGWGDVNTPNTLARAIAGFNAAGAGAHIININTAVRLTDPAKWALNNAAATLTINGNGNTAEGPGYNSWTLNVNRLTVNNLTLTVGFNTATTTLAGAGGHSFNNCSIENVALTFTTNNNTLNNSTFSGPGGTYTLTFNGNTNNTVSGCTFDRMALRFEGSTSNAISNTRFTRSGLSLVAGSNNNTVYGCRFNMNAAGTAIVTSGISYDISINASTGNIIGANTAARRNIFALTSTNSITVAANATGTRIVGNYFGTNPAGTVSLSGAGTNSTILISASQNVVVDSNVVASMQGSAGGAIEAASGNSSGLKIRYNLIGVNAAGAGTAAFYNNNNGIFISGGTVNNLDIIGNTVARSSNIGLRFSASINTLTIRDNKIGSNSTGLHDGSDYGNGHGGITLESGTISNVTIHNNVLVRNGWATEDNYSCGIYVPANVSGISITQNKIGVYADDNATGPSGNSFSGIFFRSTSSNITISNNVIGRNGLGTTKSHGISTQVNITNITITNNYIGITSSGTAIGNGSSGIDLQNVTTGTISGNYICSNEGRRADIPAAGISLSSGTNQVSITGNRIGLSPNGTGAGQQLNGSYDGSAIRTEGTANRILIHDNDLAYSAGNGVNVVAGADFVQIFDNRIYCNTLKGINLNCGGDHPNGPGNNSFGCGTITLDVFTPIPTNVSGGRPANSVVYVYNTGSCQTMSCGPNPQGENRFTTGTTTYPSGSTWAYNHGALMYNDITALAVGTGANCNGGYCRTSEFSNCVDNTLPVTLLSFEASVLENGTVLIHWQTTSEVNNAFFILERSTDGIGFEAIGKVNGKGNTSELSTYLFTDRTAGTGIVYYRLKQVDFDGSYGYSPSRKVSIGQEGLITVYPNPNPGTFTIAALQGGHYKIAITNMAGQEVYYSEVYSETLLEKNIQTSLAPGTYVLQVLSETTMSVHKLVVE